MSNRDLVRFQHMLEAAQAAIAFTFLASLPQKRLHHAIIATWYNPPALLSPLLGLEICV